VIEEPEPKVVAEWLPLQEEISPRPTKVVKLPIETLVDLPAESSMDLIPTVIATRTSFFLRSPDVYDPLQIFIQEPVSQEIGILVYGLDFGGAMLTYYVACILLELPSMTTCLSRKPVPPPPLWLRCDELVILPRPPPWPD